MKTSNCLITLAILAAAAGCRSADTDARVTSSSTSQRVVQTTAPQSEQASAAEPVGQTVQQGTVGNYIYTVEVIPNQRLSATSREGDKSTEVYSSNIIAVYVHPRNGTTVNSTDVGGNVPESVKK
jgi:TRAP-type C4-dicarboxylate transport system substrate-binding protein